MELFHLIIIMNIYYKKENISFIPMMQKTELVILGSGTKLINTNYSNYTIDYTKKVDIDDISNNGLAAFANTDWKTMKFTADKYLAIQEMQFITLTEGDTLSFYYK